MAFLYSTISLPHSIHSRSRPIIIKEQIKNRGCPRTIFFPAVSCQNGDHGPDDSEKDKRNPAPSPLTRILSGCEKLGKGLRDSLRPQRKGDWKDLTLMSLSFAVYVYMSQKIVCAYYAWTFMPKQPW